MVLFLSTLLQEKEFSMLKISDAINVHVLQLPNDKNGKYYYDRWKSHK